MYRWDSCRWALRRVRATWRPICSYIYHTYLYCPFYICSWRTRERASRFDNGINTLTKSVLELEWHRRCLTMMQLASGFDGLHMYARSTFYRIASSTSYECATRSTCMCAQRCWWWWYGCVMNRFVEKWMGWSGQSSSTLQIVIPLNCSECIYKYVSEYRYDCPQCSCVHSIVVSIHSLTLSSSLLACLLVLVISRTHIHRMHFHCKHLHTLSFHHHHYFIKFTLISSSPWVKWLLFNAYIVWHTHGTLEPSNVCFCWVSKVSFVAIHAVNCFDLQLRVRAWVIRALHFQFMADFHLVTSRLIITVFILLLPFVFVDYHTHLFGILHVSNKLT